MLSAFSNRVGLRPSADLGNKVLARIDGEHVAVMLFGSCARGDQTAASDVDVLQLVRSWHPSYDTGLCSISVYSCARLRELARAGSLFVLHLATEGRMIDDPTGELSRILGSYQAPASYDGARDKLRQAATVLDVDRKTFDRNPDGFLRVGLHILRTVLYVRCVELGHPTFSMPRVAQLLGEPQINDLFARRGARTYAFLVEIRAALSRELGVAGNNEFGTLEALAVALYETCPIASYFALKILGGGARIEYDGAFLDWVGDV